jgi:hypothetical protein
MDYSVSIRCSGNACLANRLLAMDFRSGTTIPAFRRHVTIFYLLHSYCPLSRNDLYKSCNDISTKTDIYSTFVWGQLSALLKWTPFAWSEVYDLLGKALKGRRFILCRCQVLGWAPMGNIFNGVYVFSQNSPRTAPLGQTSYVWWVRKYRRERSCDLF